MPSICASKYFRFGLWINQTITEPDSHNLWSPHPWEMRFLTCPSMGSPLVNKRTIKETAVMRCVLTVHTLLRTLTSSSPSTCLNEEPKGSCPSSLQTKQNCASTEKMCVLGDSAHLVIDSPKFFRVQFLFTSTKSGSLFIGVLNLLQLSFLLIHIFQPPWVFHLLICGLISGLKFFSKWGRLKINMNNVDSVISTLQIVK